MQLQACAACSGGLGIELGMPTAYREACREVAFIQKVVLIHVCIPEGLSCSPLVWWKLPCRPVGFHAQQICCFNNDICHNCQLRLQQAWRLTQRPCAASRFPEGFLCSLHHLHAIVPWNLISACFRAAVKAGIDSPMALCTLP